jgi:hypothetical protein
MTAWIRWSYRDDHFTETTEGITMALKYRTFGITMALAMLGAMPAHADTTMGIQGSDGLNTSIQIRNGKGRVSSIGRDDYLLYDSGTSVITYVEPASQQYTQMSVAELEATLQTAKSVKQTIAPYMDSMLAGLSEEQRNMVEQRMGSIPGAPAAGKPVTPVDISIVDQGKQTVAGLQCQASKLLKNGKTVAEVCMATSASGKISAEDFATLETLVKLSRSMADHYSGMPGDMGMQAELLALELHGIPVQVKDIEHGKYYHVATVTDAALSDSLFDGYKGFQKQGVQNLLK